MVQNSHLAVSNAVQPALVSGRRVLPTRAGLAPPTRACAQTPHGLTEGKILTLGLFCCAYLDLLCARGGLKDYEVSLDRRYLPGTQTTDQI